MFNKSQLTLLIGALLAAPLTHAEQLPLVEDADETMLVTGRDYGYKVDTNRSAMRIEATQLETPGQVTVIDEQLINEQRATTLGDVLKNDASISAAGDSRNRERFLLRGFALDSSSSFLRDGKSHWSHYRQPIELLESVEVLKGPASLLYGESGPGGLINMVGKKPTYETQINISQDIGSNNSTRTTADISGSLNAQQTLRSRLVLSQQNYDSWREYSDASTASTDRFIGGLFVDYDLSDAVTISLHYDRTTDNGGVDSGAYIKQGEVVLGDKYIWDAQWSKINNEVENTGVDINAQLTDIWRLSASVNYQDFKRHDVESYPTEESYNPTTGSYKNGGNDRRDHWIFRTANMDFIGEFSTGSIDHQLLIGANWLGYSYDRLQYALNTSTTEVGQATASPQINPDAKVKQSHSEYDSWGFYLQDMLTLNEQWQVLMGMRFDRQVNSGLVEEALSPKMAVIYHPADNGSIYVTYSESFEPQGEVNGSEYVNEGQKLDPLRGKLYELGSKWELFDQQLFVSAAVFEITQENSTIDVGVGSGLYIKTQAGERQHRGAELAMQGYLTQQFSLSGSATYLDAKYIKDEHYQGNRPADVPEFSASLWSRYEFVNNVDLNVGAIYVGSRYGDAANTFKKEGYTRIDLGISHTYKYDKELDIIVRFNIENLFDTDYLGGGGSTGDDYATNGAQNVVIGEERNFMASIQVRY